MERINTLKASNWRTVRSAKMMITEVLDTSTNSRVTMKMDVSYTDHSHIMTILCILNLTSTVFLRTDETPLEILQGEC